MRVWPAHWHAETWVCSLRGHEAPGARVAHVGPADVALAADLDDGRRAARCLRCDACLVDAPPAAPERERLGPLDQLDWPRRGKPLEDAIILRLVAIERAIHVVAFAILALALLLLEVNLHAVHDVARRFVDGINGPIAETGQGAGHSWVTREAAKVLDLHASELRLLLATATLYAVVEGIEAWGLWRERRWAEYLTVVATAGFLPLELHELTVRVTFLRLGALVVNLAVLVWLVWNKRLFGVRGGAAALATSTDWAEVLAHPTPAGTLLAATPNPAPAPASESP